MPGAARRDSLLALVVANALILVLAIIGAWDPADVLLLYWAESAVIGVYNVGRMALASGEGTVRRPRLVGGVRLRSSIRGGRAPKPFLIPFFMFHYGVFMLVHLVFILAIGSRIGSGGRASFHRDGFFEGLDFSAGMLVSVGILFASHGVSFVRNYIGRREYAEVDAVSLMFLPYGRIIFMHLTLIGGAFVFTGLPWLPAWLLVVPKVAADAWSHAREHGLTRKGRSIAGGFGEARRPEE